MRKKVIPVILGLVAVVVLSALTACAMADRKKKDDLYQEVGLFADSLVIVQSEYVDETKPKELIYGALKGMLSSLDPHSQFMDPQAYEDLKTETEGKFGGLGIEVAIKDGLLTIVTPLEDTPAWKAGVKSGDRIVKIDNELTRDMGISDAVKKLRGSPGEPVNITVLRESENKLLDFKIVRALIKIKDIKEARILENGIGYIKLLEFRENTDRDFSSALNKLNKEGMNALILDLRNNPGGLLESAVKVAEKFIPKGKMIVYTRGRQPAQDLEFPSNVSGHVFDLPMAVLINEGSASGSEIVAGCLQDYHRAIIVGTKSFGKGSVQTVIPLGDGSALRLTTAKYFTPLGKVIHEKGVTPDIVVNEGKVESAEPEEESDDRAKRVFEEVEKKEKEKKPKEGFDYKSDVQLVRAVDMLKALKLYRTPCLKETDAK